MTDAAAAHLATVQSAQSETETLAAEISHIKPAIEEATGMVLAAFTTLSEKIAVITAQAATAKDRTEQARTAGADHVSASLAPGHHTRVYAIAAEEACQTADANLDGLADFLGNLHGAVEEGSKTASGMLLGMIPEIESGTDGVKLVVDQLEEAETQINFAIHPS